MRIGGYSWRKGYALCILHGRQQNLGVVAKKIPWISVNHKGYLC